MSDIELQEARRWLSTNIHGHQLYDPILADVEFCLIPVTAFRGLELGGLSGLPAPQPVGQVMLRRDFLWAYRRYYIVAKPRIMSGITWHRVRHLLAQRVPILDAGLQYDLQTNAAPGFSGIAISYDGRLYVYLRGANLGEARWTRAFRSVARQAAAAAMARINRAEIEAARLAWERERMDFALGPTGWANALAMPSPSLLPSIGSIARSVLNMAPGPVQRGVNSALALPWNMAVGSMIPSAREPSPPRRRRHRRYSQ